MKIKKTKPCYDYSPHTLEFIREGHAQLDPLETEKAGKPVWLTPANATHTPPPEIPEGKKAIYDPETDGWNLVDTSGDD